MTTTALRAAREETKIAPAPTSSEFEPFLRGPSTLGVSSRKLDWRGFILEEHTALEGERPETTASQHLLIMWRGKRSTGECAYRRGIFTPYTRLPGTFNFFPTGRVHAARPYGQTAFLLCAFDPVFVNQLRNEMERRPDGELQVRYGLEDRTAYQLLLLLREEVAGGGPSGRLFADHLVHALTSRIVTAAEVERTYVPSIKSGLPRHLLQRVIDLMRNLRADLNLQSLADEAGYSQSHFLRMFQTATGQTPHQYRLWLRVARAQELLRHRNISLIDVAFYCGFSSHSHMTMVFRRLLGVTPSELRRDLGHSAQEETFAERAVSTSRG